MSHLPNSLSISSGPSGVPVEVVFGFQHPECAGRGICRMESALEMARLNNRSCSSPAIRGSLTYHSKQQWCTLAFLLRNIDHLTWNTQFATGSLLLEKQVSLSHSIKRQLALSDDYYFPKGEYALLVVADRIEFRLPLMTSKNEMLQRRLLSAKVNEENAPSLRY